MMSIMKEAKNIAYQDDLVLKPISTREDLNSLAFSRGHQKRKSFVIPLRPSNGYKESNNPKWPELVHISNPSSQSYLVGVFFEDFIDLSDQNLFKSFTGFTFQKLIMIKTKVALNELMISILNSFIGKL